MAIRKEDVRRDKYGGLFLGGPLEMKSRDTRIKFRIFSSSKMVDICFALNVLSSKWPSDR